MRSKLIWSFLSLVAVSTAALVSGCDGDATIKKSGEGESCDSAADCADGYKCLQGACYKTAPGGGEGGEGTVGPTPPVLGGEGESCTRRADCEDGLACFNQRCAMDVSGEGGGGNVPTIRLGQLGETCTVSSDCDPTLACLPGGLGTESPIGQVGVCSRPGGGYVPTGKSCGAECVEDADCCELPVALHIAWLATSSPGVGEPYGTGAQSCAELAALIGAANCGTAVAGTALAARCFAQAAYCECDDTWSCNEGKCSYVADCDANGPTPGGCPQFTRSGAPTPTISCDLAEGGSNKCQPAVQEPACTRTADCGDGEHATADTGELCAEDECVCYEAQCYRSCNSPLDCAPGYTCSDDNVCEPVPQCTTNEECAVLPSGGPQTACVDGACKTTCATDYECNNGSFTDGINTRVCYEGFCEKIGCASDDQCTNGDLTNPVKMFCVDDVAPGEGGVRSAITD